MRSLALALLAGALVAPPASGQPALFLSQRPERVGNFELRFSFRMSETVQDGGVHDLWGIDSGADIGIGLAYGVGNRFDLEVLRSSHLETFELAAKLALSDQAAGQWASVALRAGIDASRGSSEDRERPFGQLLVARRLGRGVTLQVAPSWIRDTPRLRNAFNVPVGLTLPLGGGSLIKLEAVPENRDFEDSVLGWRVAFSKATKGHLLELTLGNSRAMTLDQILGGDFAGGVERGDVRLGINVVRYFHLAD
jgi:hypothetical protein